MKKLIVRWKMPLVVFAALVVSVCLIVSGGSKSAYAEPPVTLHSVPNMGFENGMDGWSQTGDAQILQEGAQEGSKYAELQPHASLTRVITGVTQGSYTLNLHVRGTASDNTASITMSDMGGPDSVLRLDSYMKPKAWTATAHRNVLVYNGQLRVTVTAGNAELDIDGMNLQEDSLDDNGISNWDFEQGLQQWQSQGKVVADSGNADSGLSAVRLGDGSEISQTVSVRPCTKYALTARTKVDRQDVFSTEAHNNWRGQDGLLVNRESTGDRINIGVRGTDSSVIRQAPSGTTGYSLTTIVFTTGPSQREITIYANTILDKAYTDSVTLHKTSGTYVDDDWKGNGDDGAWVDNFDLFEMRDSNILKGADVSFLPLIEDNGGKYFANGVQQDCLNILSNHGVNSITNMIFVQAGNDTYTGSDLHKYYQSWNDANGNPMPYRMPQGGYFDKTHSAELGVRATALGMSYLPSFHFSDSWMSAAKGYTPLAWLHTDYNGKMTNSDLSHIKTSVYNYVYDFMTCLVNRHIDIAGVKTGNEQDGGMIWPVGKGGTSQAHADIITASYDAIKDVVPDVPTYVHTNNGYDAKYSSKFFGDLQDKGARFDGEGHSLYGGRSSGNIIKIANAMSSSDKDRYKDYVNVEAGYSFTRYKATFDQQTSQMTQSGYAGTPNGQYNWLLDYMQAPLDAPNPYHQTRGFYYWETDWIPTPGAASTEGGSADVNQRIMFNNGDPAIKEMGSSENGKAGDMMDSMYAYLIRGVVKAKSADTSTPLSTDNGIGNGVYVVNPTQATGLSIRNSALDLAVGQSARIEATIQPTNQVLADSSLTYSSSNTKVATVSSGGFVVGVGAGDATITLRTGNGKTTTATVSVHATHKAEASDLSVTVGGKQISDGGVVNAKALDTIDLVASLNKNVTDQSVKLTSSDTNVATFFGETWQTKSGSMKQQTDNGSKAQLSVKNSGDSTITVKSADSGASMSFTLKSTKVPVRSISLDKSGEVTLSEGRTLQLKATVQPQDATLYKVRWETSDASVADVDDHGLVTSKAQGNVVIKAVAEDDPNVYAQIQIAVVPVKVEGVALNKATLILQNGSTKQIIPLVSPDDAANKSVMWSCEDSSIASVDAQGYVTGKNNGTTRCTVTTVDGGYAASISVKVQESAIEASGIKLDQHTVWMKSDKFSSSPTGEDATVKLTATVQPEDATENDVVWSSSNEDIATVNQLGVVYAKAPGVVTITATTKDGRFKDKASVNIPRISEDFDNLDIGNNAGFGKFQNFAGTLEPKVIQNDDNNKVLRISGGGSGGRATSRVFSPMIVNNKIVFDVDWNVGEISGSKGGYLTIADSKNNRYLSLQTNSGSELSYVTGGVSSVSDTNSALVNTSDVGDGFNKSNVWYNVHVELDFSKQEITFTVTPKGYSTEKATHVVPFASNVDYDGLASLQLWGTRSAGILNWKTQLDNLAVYEVGPCATSVHVDQNSVKLIPIKDTLSSTHQIAASVKPDDFNQKVTYTSLNPDVLNVTEQGLVSPVKYYSDLDSIVPSSGTVRVASKSSPGVYADVSVFLTNTPGASEFFDVCDADTGDSVSGGSVQLNVGDHKHYLAQSTGGDGVVLFKSLEWSSEDPAIVTVKATTGEVMATGSGTTKLHVRATLYNSDTPLTSEIIVHVSGGEPQVVDSIRVDEQPDKKIYVIGDSFDSTGLKVSSYAGKKRIAQLTDKQYSLSGFDSDAPGDKNLVVSLKSQPTLTDAFKVRVEDPVFPSQANLLSNPSFESDWTDWEATWNKPQGAVKIELAKKSSNVHEGKKNLNAWSASDMDFTVDHHVTGLAKGWYTFSGWVTGDTGHEDDIELYAKDSSGNIIDKKRQTLPGKDAKGVYEWLNPQVSTFHVGDGQATVGFSVKQKAGGWASLDDFSLVRVQPPMSAMTSLQIISQPTKAQYALGESFDDSGLVVRGRFPDGTTAPLEEAQYKITGFDSASAGIKTITIALRSDPSVQAQFQVSVLAPASSDATLSFISVAGHPIDLDEASAGKAVLTIDDPASLKDTDVKTHATDENATVHITVEGGVISVTVTAQDGRTQKTYKVSLRSDFSQLSQSVEKVKKLVERDYTTSSWASLQQALQQAQSLMQNALASKADIDKTEKSITQAVSSLVTISGLRDDLVAVGLLHQGSYTASSWKRLEAAVAMAKGILADPQASPSDIASARSALQRARTELIQLSSKTPGVDESTAQTRDPNSAGKENPGTSDLLCNTGVDVSGSVLGACALLVMGCCILWLRLRWNHL